MEVESVYSDTQTQSKSLPAHLLSGGELCVPGWGRDSTVRLCWPTVILIDGVPSMLVMRADYSGDAEMTYVDVKYLAHAECADELCAQRHSAASTELEQVRSDRSKWQNPYNSVDDMFWEIQYPIEWLTQKMVTASILVHAVTWCASQGPHPRYPPVSAQVSS